MKDADTTPGGLVVLWAVLMVLLLLTFCGGAGVVHFFRWGWTIKP